MYRKNIYLILLIVFIFPSCKKPFSNTNDNKKDDEWSLVWPGFGLKNKIDAESQKIIEKITGLFTNRPVR